MDSSNSPMKKGILRRTFLLLRFKTGGPFMRAGLLSLGLGMVVAWVGACAVDDGVRRHSRAGDARSDDGDDDEQADSAPRRRRRHAAGSEQGNTTTECKMGTDGHQACGYHCTMGTDGVMVCADTEDGSCAMGTDGRVTCSRVAAGRWNGRSSAPTECRMGTDGRNVCGYNCQMGTNGRMYCSSVPNGRCAMNTDGTFSCP